MSNSVNRILTGYEGIETYRPIQRAQQVTSEHLARAALRLRALQLQGNVVGGWPTRYVNRDTGATYVPHNDDERAIVYDDFPRRVLLKGGEGCMAGNTLIEGVPLEEWQGGYVSTLQGVAVAGRAYRKGRADLYRVRTRSGREVLVTLDHRFLTPAGWRQLRRLVVGSLVAGHGSVHAPAHQGTATGSLGRCSSDSRPGDGRPSPSLTDALDRLLRSGLPRIDDDLFAAHRALLLDRPYRTHSEVLEVLPLLLDEYALPLYSGDARSHPRPRRTSPTDASSIPQPRRAPAFQEHLTSLADDLMYPHQQQRDDNALPPPTRLIPQRWLVGSDLDASVLGLARAAANAPVLSATRCSEPRASEADCFDLPPDCSFTNTPTNVHEYTAHWDVITSIAHVSHGDFYDLQVYGAEHYEAGGLYHHNSGKSVAGIIKCLDRLRRGCVGIMGSPDMPHFRRSLWPEFQRWCPWGQVLPRLRHYGRPDWEPNGSFILTFINGAQLYCGGFDEPEKWEGPNMNFAHVDEARRKKDPQILKVLDGRIRIPGPGGIPPQLWLTTTPKKHWLFDYFGPLVVDDPRADFKVDSRTVTLRVEENAANLSDGYIEARRASLTEAEARVLMNAEWEDVNDTESFLSSMILWETLAESMPVLQQTTPLVLAADAGVSHDHFALVGVSAHPRVRGRAAVRLVREWVPPRGGSLDFDVIEKEIELICRTYRVVQLAYDPYQLHQMMTSLKNRRIVDTLPFNQGTDRLIADKALLDEILAGLIAHDGNVSLADAIRHADRQVDASGARLRLVKREAALKIDLAVALSMSLSRFRDPHLLASKDVGLPAGVAVAGISRGSGLPSSQRRLPPGVR